MLPIWPLRAFEFDTLVYALGAILCLAWSWFSLPSCPSGCPLGHTHGTQPAAHMDWWTVNSTEALTAFPGWSKAVNTVDYAQDKKDGEVDVLRYKLSFWERVALGLLLPPGDVSQGQTMLSI